MAFGYTGDLPKSARRELSAAQCPMACCCSDRLQALVSGCPCSGSAQGQAGCGPGQPDLVDGTPAHCEGWELGDLKGLFQIPSKPSHSMICVKLSKHTVPSWCIVYLC